ncbi:MAG: hypothetical protein HOV80_04250 [Polyangiaceae bacterium]|nr:hypothetical protein [Polyangiaceae bacterium]
MRLGFSGLWVGLSSVGLMACLADIPELTGATGSTGVGGGATTTAAATTGNGFCADQVADFCADFDGQGGVTNGWDFHHEGPDIHFELDAEKRVSEPNSGHIWVDPDAAVCTYAQLRKSVNEDASDPPFNFNFEFLAKITGIVAELNWGRGATLCQVLVYVNDDNITLSLREQSGMFDTGASIDIPEPPYEEWHDLKIRIDRATRGFVVQYDGMTPTVAVAMSAGPWLEACADADPEPGGRIDLGIGSYCVATGSDESTDAYFDNVTFEFE